MSRKAVLAAACAGVLATCGLTHAQIVINEFHYDDTGAADDREFVELFNTGAAPVDLGGWVLTGRDPGGTKPSIIIPSGTMLGAGQFYVIGNAGVLNVNQTAATDFLQNDNETIELQDPSLTLIDAVAYETNKGAGFANPVTAQVGPGVFGNNQGIDLAGTPLTASVSVGRFVDGRDTNNNGRDFGMRPASPGTSNRSGTMTFFNPPDPTPLAVGTAMPGMRGSFVNVLVIDPQVATTNNPNAIPPSPTSGNRAYVAWDPSGGGNGATSNAVFNTTQSGFILKAYFDTRDIPQNFNSANPPVNFRGSEVTIYGIGGADPLTNLTDLTGALAVNPGTLPGSDTANGFTGVAWVYEKAGISGGGGPSEMLHLVDANDGGDSDLGGNTPLDWTVLASVDLSTTDSGWYDLGITIDPTGNGVATFNGQTFNFTTSPNLHSGAFNVGYRENLQLGTDLTPDAIMRPPTFTIIPEPGSLALAGVAGLLCLRRRTR